MKLTETLQNLLTVMEDVEEQGKVLKMAWFFADEPSVSDLLEHNCGSSACIVGYAVAHPLYRSELEGELHDFPAAAVAIGFSQWIVSKHYEELSSYQISPREFFRSIFGVNKVQRKGSFEYAFKEHPSFLRWKDDIEHLIASDDSSPSAAVGYLAFLLDGIKKLENQNDNK